MSDGNHTIAKRSAIVHIKNIAQNWAVLSGGSSTSAVTLAWNGGVPKADVIAGRPDIAEIVVSRPFIPNRDRELERRLQSQVGFGRYDVTLQDLDSNGQFVGRPKVFTDCLVTKVQGREYDETSNNPAELMVTLKPSNVA